MKKNDMINNYLDAVIQKRMTLSSKANLKFYLEYLFEDISFVGKSMLDIGGGSGLYSFYGSIMGHSREEMEAKLEEIISFADIGEFINQPLKNYPM